MQKQDQVSEIFTVQVSKKSDIEVPSNEEPKLDFHYELKLTFDAIRNSGLAAGFLAVAKYVADNKNVTFEIEWLYGTTITLLILVSFFLQTSNCYSYCAQISKYAKYKVLFYLGTIVFVGLMLLIYLSTIAQFLK